jgi:hypothetical protein
LQPLRRKPSINGFSAWCIMVRLTNQSIQQLLLKCVGI